MAASLVGVGFLILIVAFCLAAIRGAFSDHHNEDQSWTAPRSSHPSKVISIRTRRAA